MVVTRFAPSPTGYLHIGGARTALFCLLWARKTGGKFILRIEDTDQNRNTPTAMQQVLDDLCWLGLNWDEGPQVGGPNGPYLQSQRLAIYQKYVDKLLDSGLAYYCFDTPEELRAMREKAAAAKQNFTYPRPAKFPTLQDVKQAREQGKPVVVRFCMTNNEIVVNDLIRGQVRFNGRELGDFIILKSDGFPTYHFACVVDDELMGITHVLRGQEHLMNTPCHIALQKALDFRTPQYAHITLTVNQGGGKLSKRDRAKALREHILAHKEIDINRLIQVGGLGENEMKEFLEARSVPDNPQVDAMAEYLGIHLPEINVIDFRRSGYLPEAIVNFIALLGWNPGGDREIMTFEQLIEAFDPSRFSSANSLFDRSKLIAFNTEHIKMLDPEKLLMHFKEYLNANKLPMAGADDAVLGRLLQICHGARTLEEVKNKSEFLFMENDKIRYDSDAVDKILLKGEKQGLEMLWLLRDKLAQLSPVNARTLEAMLRGLAEEKAVGLGKVAQPLRVAITGTTVSPPIFDSIDMLGMDNTLARIDNTLKRFEV